jgi:hypothetical protein
MKLIVEDLSSFNNDGKGVCCNYTIHAHGGVLGRLADVARSLFIEVDNVEYRFCRVAGIGPLLNNPYIQPKNFASASSIYINNLYHEVLEELKCIASYNDDNRINNLYKSIRQEVMTSLNKLKLDRVGNLSITNYCMQLSKKNYIKCLEQLCIFDSPIIDAKILHSILSSYKSIIIVAAGGSHIEKMNTYLELVGYKKMLPPNPLHTSQKVENSFEFEGKRNQQGFRPSAINLHILDKIINQ